MKGRVREVMQLERRDGRRGTRRQDAVDGEERRRRALRQRPAKQQRGAEQRGRLPAPRVARAAHALAPVRRHGPTDPHREAPREHSAHFTRHIMNSMFFSHPIR